MIRTDMIFCCKCWNRVTVSGVEINIHMGTIQVIAKCHGETWERSFNLKQQALAHYAFQESFLGGAPGLELWLSSTAPTLAMGDRRDVEFEVRLLCDRDTVI